MRGTRITAIGLVAAVGGALLGMGTTAAATSARERVPAGSGAQRLMGMSRLTTRSRAIGAIVLAAALSGGGAALTAISQTEAVWTDQSVASATVTSGTWVTAPVGSTCTALNWRGNAVGTCTVQSIRYEEWGSAGNHTRNMYLTFTVSSSATQSIRFDVDLASATGTPSGSGAWNWASAATSSGGQITPTSACTALPRLQGTTVSGWSWQLSPPVYFAATDNRSAAAPGSISCK